MEEETPTNEGTRGQERAERRAGRRRQRAQRGHYRSFFWPVLLIGVGALWLLTNLGVISAQNFAVLGRIWPILLVVVGLDLLVGRASPWLGALVGLAAVALVVGLIIAGPSLGLVGDDETLIFGLPVRFSEDVEVYHDTFEAALGDAESAEIDLSLSFEQATVGVLSGSDNLVEADLDYVGTITFDVSGDEHKQVHLHQSDVELNLFGPFPFINQELKWDIGLSPDLPLDLRLDGGAGPATADLAALDLSMLTIDAGAGPLTVNAPGGSYEAQVDAGAGPLTLSLDDGADVSMRLDAGVGPVTLNVREQSDLSLEVDAGAGPVTLDLPDGLAARIVVQDEGAGPVTVASRFERVDDGGDDDRDTGTWESPGFDDADHQVTITLTSAGAGPFSVR